MSCSYVVVVVDVVVVYQIGDQFEVGFDVEVVLCWCVLQDDGVGGCLVEFVDCLGDGFGQSCVGLFVEYSEIESYVVFLFDCFEVGDFFGFGFVVGE